MDKAVVVDIGFACLLRVKLMLTDGWSAHGERTIEVLHIIIEVIAVELVSTVLCLLYIGANMMATRLSDQQATIAIENCSFYMSSVYSKQTRSTR